MSIETTSPGMRALEAIEGTGDYEGTFQVMRVRNRRFATPHERAKFASIIERETHCVELAEENRRLRDAANDTENYHTIACQELERANGELRDVKAKSVELAEALKPLACDEEGPIDDNAADDAPMYECSEFPTVGQVRMARAALAAYRGETK